MKSFLFSIRDSSWKLGNRLYGFGTHPSRVTTARSSISRSSTLSSATSSGRFNPLCAQTPFGESDTLPRGSERNQVVLLSLGLPDRRFAR